MGIEGYGSPRPLGAHMSIQGGFPKAVERANRAHATALQIFTRNQLRWESPPLRRSEVRRFRNAVATAGIDYLCAHASYLINLATLQPALWQKSVDALVDELRRADALGCHCLILHPGSPVKPEPLAGAKQVAAGLRQALAATKRLSVCIALENTAGQGATLGGTIGELTAIIEGAGGHERLGLCLDTCHAYAAGFDLADPHVVADLMGDLSRKEVRGRLYLLHLNDSKAACGSKLDRHQHIGLGQIGEQGFHNVLTHPDLKGLPGIIETPKKSAGDVELDKKNLALLRTLEE